MTPSTLDDTIRLYADTFMVQPGTYCHKCCMTMVKFDFTGERYPMKFQNMARFFMQVSGFTTGTIRIISDFDMMSTHEVMFVVNPNTFQHFIVHVLYCRYVNGNNIRLVDNMSNR